MNASWVAIDLMEFAVRTEDAVQSPEAALEWLRSFRDTLLMEGRNAMPMPWAVELLGMADVKIAKKSIARMQGQIVKLFGKDCDVDLECEKKYGEKYEKLKKILADGDIREDSLAKPDGSAITRNGSRATCTSATSGQTIEAPLRPGAGEVPPENVSAKPSPALPLPAKRQHGEFGNVLLTDDEFAKLCEKCPDADALITELDQYIESQGKTKKYKSHYATLLNWSRRKAQESKPKQGYMTSDDISKKNYQESKARLEAMFAKGRKTA